MAVPNADEVSVWFSGKVSPLASESSGCNRVAKLELVCFYNEKADTGKLQV